jgi:hypothetical protein
MDIGIIYILFGFYYKTNQYFLDSHSYKFDVFHVRPYLAKSGKFPPVNTLYKGNTRRKASWNRESLTFSDRNKFHGFLHSEWNWIYRQTFKCTRDLFSTVCMINMNLNVE